LGTTEIEPIVLHVVTENIGAGGVGVLSDRLIYPDTVVRCEFAIVGSAIHLPTIMKVRWADKVNAKREYRLGLEFLI
jgi:hypothetical protein